MVEDLRIKKYVTRLGTIFHILVLFMYCVLQKPVDKKDGQKTNAARGLGVNKGTVRILKITKKIARERLKEEDAFLNSKRN
ncbi:hypothetical protein pdam_00020391 [Pocillopora damicornis]|uniref:Uncharacterized protein n=1 Tax=Pocillopora damicornis TaxID=46731 RepID=A0A3M6UQX7_POCDA|nr:hypothetical protein pdam_00020391 [Pocillopora damicornis]